MSISPNSRYAGGGGHGHKVGLAEKAARRLINRGKVTYGPKDFEVKDSDRNLIGVVIPSLLGKTTLANQFGWLDVDDLTTDDKRNQLFATFSQRYAEDGWCAAMRPFNEECEASIDRMYFYSQTVILAHSVSSLAYLGVIPSIRIAPSDDFAAKLLSLETGGSAAFAKANIEAVREEADSSPLVTVSSYDELSATAVQLAIRLGHDVDCKAVSQDDAIDQYECGLIERDDADRLVREHGGLHRGFGRTRSGWARAVACIGCDNKPALSVTVDKEVLDKANCINRAVVGRILTKSNKTSAHVQALLTFVVAFGKGQLLDVISNLLTTPESDWERVMRGISSLVKTSNSYMGYDLSDDERRVMSELWLLGHQNRTSMAALMREWLLGCGGTYKSIPTSADIRKAADGAGLAGGRTVRQSLQQALKMWAETWRLSDKASLEALQGVDLAFGNASGTSWYKACRIIYLTYESDEIGEWLSKLVSVREQDVREVDWKRRVESAVSSLLLNLLAGAIGGIEVEKHSCPVRASDCDALSAVILMMGIRQVERDTGGLTTWAAGRIAETMTMMESKVVTAIEASLIMSSGDKAHELWANIWQRGAIYHMPGMMWMARHKFDHKRRSDGYIKAYLARLCSPKSKGGSGRVSMTGSTFHPEQRWSGKHKQQGEWRRASGSTSLVELRGIEDVPTISCGEAIKSTKAVALGLIGSCITQGLPAKKVCVVLGRLLAKRRQVLIGKVEKVEEPEQQL
ncbi:putative replication associated protein [Cryphonectria nitschkei chrysovirus 1]|uniref:Putative replication associated protein n=1 Tax=Cryphonectria nitschkei chrysovirus 1 TaxID=399394 RepID=D6QX90_9VIRU|nr:putative replication associated protein [Cryphonectria nitschkei chrysovirus 1]ADG27460.1 putative replication associated protein [Cryphonectria nitschkei chrysovirus 1]